MAECGVTFGGHGTLHSILTTLDSDEMVSEIINTRIALQEKLAGNFLPFSYPNGLSDDYNAAVMAATKDAGFDCAVSYIPGSNALYDLSKCLFELKRIHVDRGFPREVFSLMLNFPNRII